MTWLTRFTLRMLFGVRMETKKPGMDKRQKFELSADEAMAGVEKTVSIKNGLGRKKLVVNVPAGVRTGNSIRLRGMGKQGGDLYLDVKVKE